MRVPSQAIESVRSLPAILLALGSLLITGCATGDHQPSDRQPSQHAQRATISPQAAPLFVHLLAPRYYTDPPIPPKRIVTTRISLGEDFAVSVGDSGFSHSHSLGGPDSYSYAGDAVLAGRVELRGTKFFAHLVGLSHSTVNYYEGELELEALVHATRGSISGGIWSVYFALSTNSDHSAFIDRLDHLFE